MVAINLHVDLYHLIQKSVKWLSRFLCLEILGVGSNVYLALVGRRYATPIFSLA